MGLGREGEHVGLATPNRPCPARSSPLRSAKQAFTENTGLVDGGQMPRLSKSVTGSGSGGSPPTCWEQVALLHVIGSGSWGRRCPVLLLSSTAQGPQGPCLHCGQAPHAQGPEQHSRPPALMSPHPDLGGPSDSAS